MRHPGPKGLPTNGTRVQVAGKGKSRALHNPSKVDLVPSYLGIGSNRAAAYEELIMIGNGRRYQARAR